MFATMLIDTHTDGMHSTLDELFAYTMDSCTGIGSDSMSNTTDSSSEPEILPTTRPVQPTKKRKATYYQRKVRELVVI
jgi:hypothetical protein